MRAVRRRSGGLGAYRAVVDDHRGVDSGKRTRYRGRLALVLGDDAPLRHAAGRGRPGAPDHRVVEGITQRVFDVDEHRHPVDAAPRDGSLDSAVQPVGPPLVEREPSRQVDDSGPLFHPDFPFQFPHVCHRFRANVPDI